MAQSPEGIGLIPLAAVSILLAAAVLLIVSVKVRAVADLVKRTALSVSALEFKRVYAIGGIGLALMVLSSTSGDQALNVDQRLFAAAILVLPLIATAISETAFVLVRSLTKSQPVPFSFMEVEVEKTLEKPGGGAAPETKRTKTRLLTPVHTLRGGFKQVVRCFISQAFSSYFFGYTPYTGLVGPKDSRWLADGHRVTVLAKSADAADFEYFEYRAFQMKRVTDLCWILVRDPVPQDVAQAAIEARRQARDSAGAPQEDGPKDVNLPPGWQ